MVLAPSVSRVGTVVLALALSLSLVSPASAARKPATAVSGWSTSVLDVGEGQTVTAPVRVRPAGTQDKRTVMDRALDVGYRTSGIGENIAAGQPTPRAVVDAWLASPGHCQNLMRASWVDLGVGYVVTPGAPYRGYWVQMFGTGRVR